MRRAVQKILADDDIRAMLLLFSNLSQTGEPQRLQEALTAYAVKGRKKLLRRKRSRRASSSASPPPPTCRQGHVG
jgi:hypothetical protein